MENIGQCHMILSHFVQEFISSSLLSVIAPNNHASGKLWVMWEIRNDFSGPLRKAASCLTSQPLFLHKHSRGEQVNNSSNIWVNVPYFNTLSFISCPQLPHCPERYTSLTELSIHTTNRCHTAANSWQCASLCQTHHGSDQIPASC